MFEKRGAEGLGISLKHEFRGKIKDTSQKHSDGNLSYQSGSFQSHAVSLLGVPLNLTSLENPDSSMRQNHRIEQTASEAIQRKSRAI